MYFPPVKKSDHFRAITARAIPPLRWPAVAALLLFHEQLSEIFFNPIFPK
jgi:hypothetical protein